MGRFVIFHANHSSCTDAETLRFIKWGIQLARPKHKPKPCQLIACVHPSPLLNAPHLLNFIFNLSLASVADRTQVVSVTRNGNPGPYSS